MQDAPWREPDLGQIRSQLIQWYDGCRRNLPWRATRDPYAILVAEVMLQQTRVDTVLPYYVRFLQRFPTASRLAEASEDEVLQLWQGLGYYRRARNLWRAARLLVERHGGHVPADPVALRSLPGVGEYTAGAVLSIAFGLPVPAVDGNAQRVLSRLFAVSESPDQAGGRKHLRRLATSLVQGPRPGDVNQAIMELGTLLCTPRRPRCDQCPLAGQCLGRASGEPERWPLRGRRSRVQEDALVLACCLDGDRLALVRRPPSGLLGGLWALPYVRRETGETWEQARHRLAALLEGVLGRSFHWRDAPWEGRWEFSHRRWHLRAYAATVAPAGRSREDTGEEGHRQEHLPGVVPGGYAGAGPRRGGEEPVRPPVTGPAPGPGVDSGDPVADGMDASFGPPLRERNSAGLGGASPAVSPDGVAIPSPTGVMEAGPFCPPWWVPSDGDPPLFWAPVAHLERWPMASLDRRVIRELLEGPDR